MEEKITGLKNISDPDKEFSKNHNLTNDIESGIVVYKIFQAQSEDSYSQKNQNPDNNNNNYLHLRQL